VALSAQDTLTVDRLDYRFVTYSEGELLPLTFPEDADIAGLFISCQEEELFEFCSDRPFSIWIDGRYVADDQDRNCIYLSSESLCGFSNREDPFLSVVSKGGLDGVTARAILITEKQTLNPKELLVRSNSEAYWIVGFLFGCILLVSVRVVRPKSSWRFQRPNLREFSSRFLTLENVALLFLLAGINAFCYSFLIGKNEFIFVLQSLAIILLAWFGKIILTLLSGSIFKYWKAANWQLLFQLRFWMASSLLLFVVLFLDFIISSGSLSSEMMLNLGAIGSLILLVMVGVVLMTQKGLKNLHIFIYLCTTEILPITFLVYWFLK